MLSKCFEDLEEEAKAKREELIYDRFQPLIDLGYKLKLDTCYYSVEFIKEPYRSIIFDLTNDEVYGVDFRFGHPFRLTFEEIKAISEMLEKEGSEE